MSTPNPTTAALRALLEAQRALNEDECRELGSVKRARKAIADAAELFGEAALGDSSTEGGNPCP